MNKKITFLLFILILIIGIVMGILVFNKKYNTVWITDNDFLYDKAVEYIVNQYTMNGYDNNKEDYKIFTDYTKFGIESKNNKKYVYMWIIEEAYYVENNKLESSEGSSMPYKFVFENDEVIKYEIPRDGSEYGPSIRKMLPDSIEDKVTSYHMGNEKIRQQLNEHYSYLESTDIVY